MGRLWRVSREGKRGIENERGGGEGITWCLPSVGYRPAARSPCALRNRKGAIGCNTGRGRSGNELLISCARDGRRGGTLDSKSYVTNYATSRNCAPENPVWTAKRARKINAGGALHKYLLSVWRFRPAWMRIDQTSALHGPRYPAARPLFAVGIIERLINMFRTFVT